MVTTTLSRQTTSKDLIGIDPEFQRTDEVGCAYYLPDKLKVQSKTDFWTRSMQEFVLFNMM